MEYKISSKLENMKPSAIREIFKSLTNPEIIAFAAGNPSEESFPADKFETLATKIFKETPSKALQYGITEGYPPLRSQLEERLWRKFGVDKDRNTLIVVSGGQQGIELAVKTMCNPGEVVLCENPSFIGALNAFRSNGAKPVGVKMEEDGICIEELEKACIENPNAKLLYLIPTFHNPGGTTMSLEKRKKAYEIARKYGIIILEDNPYGELRFAGEDIPTIKSMDTDNIVIYCGSFSKVLSAGMRVGFVSAPPEIVSKMVVAKQVEDVHTNQFFQMLCSQFIEEYDIDAHIEKIRAIYRRKCGIMLEALDAYMPKEVKYTRPDGGLFVWLTLPERVNLQEYVAKCLEKKVAVVPGTAFTPDENEISHSFRITYATPSDSQLKEGVIVLSEVAKELL